VFRFRTGRGIVSLRTGSLESGTDFGSDGTNSFPTLESAERGILNGKLVGADVPRFERLFGNEYQFVGYRPEFVLVAILCEPSRSQVVGCTDRSGGTRVDEEL